MLNFFLCISYIAHKYEKSALTGWYHNFMKKHEEWKLGTHNLLQIHISVSVRVCTSTEMILTPLSSSVFVKIRTLLMVPFWNAFPYWNSWHSRMWPLNSLRRNGNAWTLLRGPCTGIWCGRSIGTWSLWVRITYYNYISECW